MAEALASLGLASNIVQLIGFTGSIISKSNQVYKSADGQLVEYMELEAIANHLQNLNSNLSWDTTLPQIAEKRPLTETERQLKKLCNDCDQLAGSLVTAIQDMKSQGRNKKWNSFQQALKSVWNHSKIHSITERLERYRGAIDSVLLQLLSDHIKHSNDLQAQNAQAVQDSYVNIIDRTKDWYEEMMEEMKKINCQRTPSFTLSDLSTTIFEMTEKRRYRNARLKILDLLHFNVMDDRYEQIPEAFRETFEWVFSCSPDRKVIRCPEILQSEPVINLEGWSPSLSTRQIETIPDIYGEHVEWDSFVEWIYEKEPVYWCTGKPGCGKSTLMKFLYNNPRTYEHISKWLDGRPLMRAGFFFWNSGMPMQMSRMGLLQSLLYQCLDDDPDLIPDLFPKRWRRHCLYGGDPDPWALSELTFALRSLIKRREIGFLFFIDGLDEFNEESSEIVKLVLELSTSPNVKLCVSSRPWLVFEEAFEKRPRLRLEELTKPDIQLFVSERLRGNSRYIALQEIDPLAARKLIYEIASKASGVFLWVHLVVDSLLEGLRDGDNIAELDYRLVHLPSDLEHLFRSILDDLSPKYFEQASKIFQLVRAASVSPTLLTLAFAEVGQDAAMQAPCKPISQEHRLFQEDTMRRRLNSRCKGLLEATSPWGGADAKVQYLHRTIKDYMKTQDVWDYILSGSPDFDPHAALRGSFLLQLKTLEPKAEDDVLLEHWNIVQLATHHTSISTDMIRDQIPYLEELDRAGSVFANTKILDPPSDFVEDKWIEQILEVLKICQFGRRCTDDKYPLNWTHTAILVEKDSPLLQNWDLYVHEAVESFIDLAFMLHLFPYVEYKLECGESLSQLSFEKCFLCSATQSSNFRAVQFLLEHGASTDHYDCKKTTPLQRALDQLTTIPLDGSWKECADIIELYLTHGAFLWETYKGYTIEEVISTTLGEADPKRAEELIFILHRERQKEPAEYITLLSDHMGPIGQPMNERD